MQTMAERAALAPQRIAIPEGDDEVMMAAAAEAARRGLAVPVLVGDEAALKGLAAERGYDVALFEFVDAGDSAYLDDLVARYLKLDGIIVGEMMLRASLSDSLYLSMAMLAAGDVDCAFAGIRATTGDVIAAGQILVGLADGVEMPSSVAFFEVPEGADMPAGIVAFGDSAVCVNPTASELASIAITCCDTATDLLGQEARCALISHSTCGSADNELAAKVCEAVSLAQGQRPDLAIDGEFQLDAALLERVAERKVPRESKVAGHANVLIWPNLDVGNTVVKTLQIFGNVSAYGPMLQGFKKIVCDCSRGASVEEIVGNMAVASVRAAALKARQGGER